ncbi:MAG: hypothetical protein ACJAVI_005678 [Candidatus Azotimanducaceae bacterium]|jgi:hypothetical protein
MQKLDEYNEPIVGKRETIELGYAIRDDVFQGGYQRSIECSGGSGPYSERTAI